MWILIKSHSVVVAHFENDIGVSSTAASCSKEVGVDQEYLFPKDVFLFYACLGTCQA